MMSVDITNTPCFSRKLPASIPHDSIPARVLLVAYLQMTMQHDRRVFARVFADSL